MPPGGPAALWAERRRKKELAAEVPKFACFAFNGNPVVESVCRRIQAQPDGRKLYCEQNNCQSPWRAGTPISPSAPGPVPVVVEEVVPTPTEPEIPQPSPAWQEVAQRCQEVGFATMLRTSPFELADAVTQMRNAGLAHKVIVVELGVKGHSSMSERLYALRYLTPEVRQRILDLENLPPLADLLSVAWRPVSKQQEHLTFRLERRVRIDQHKMIDLTERTEGWLHGRVGKDVSELERRLSSVGSNLPHPDTVHKELDGLIAALQRCKRLVPRGRP